MIGLLTLVSFLVLGVGIYGLIRGRVAKLRIQSRKTAGLVLLVGFVLLVITSSLAPNIPPTSENVSESLALKDDGTHPSKGVQHASPGDCAQWIRLDTIEKGVRVADFLKIHLKVKGNAWPEPVKNENVRAAFIVISMQETDSYCKENIKASIDSALAQTVATMHTKLKSMAMTQAREEEKRGAEEPITPTDQNEFTRIVLTNKARYDAGSNELQKSLTRRDRKRALSGLLPSLKVNDWMGKLVKMGTTSDGKAYIAVEVASNIHLKTWNNALSDISSKTLFDQDTNIYRFISGLREGQSVQFSGSFLPSDKDFLEEASVTEHGSMTSPEFIFRFATFTPVGQR